MVISNYSTGLTESHAFAILCPVVLPTTGTYRT